MNRELKFSLNQAKRIALPNQQAYLVNRSRGVLHSPETNPLQLLARGAHVSNLPPAFPMLRVPNPRGRERERERKREVEREVTQQIVAGLTFAVPSFASKWYLSNLLDVKTNEDGDERKMRERRS